MARAGVATVFTFMLVAGCGEAGLGTRAPDSPYAPGVSKRGEAVDAMIVAHRLIAAGEFELAIDAYSRAAVEQGLTADILAGLGTANLGLGRLGTAEKLLRDAVEQDQDNAEMWNNLGVVLLEQGQTGEAQQVFKRAYALDNGQSDSIRDNLRLVLAKSENSIYSEELEQDYKLVRRGSSDYLIRSIPD